ncbi:Protein OSB2- chloroplastic [Striga hermonthica]|uniref:Protein OSB2- chloroplastic n=1 Tax=Striga hermonthica TaxID=68872 RepID=A0A9N7NGX6_STRHE|nr:Protein OSB2- chloroplastic [Striga hermonthica]
MSSHLISSSNSPVTRLLNLRPQTAFLLQCERYSTKTTMPGASQKPSKTKAQKPSAPPSTTFSQRIRKQTEALTGVWPKPGEMPYQAKVTNFVNLIGRVGLPIRFESDAEGKHLAATVISLLNGGARTPLTIPVVFEGVLAHSVSCHVRENDLVFVSGHLSVDPTGVLPGESLGKFHVVAENINFVEGFKGSSSSSEMEIGEFSVNEAKVYDEISERVDNDVDDDGNDNKNEDIEQPPKPTANLESADGGESGLKKGDGKKKEADKSMELWRDLVKNPLQWYDYREQKKNRSVKEKHPDFKQKVTGEALWISSAPKWILPGLGKLEFDVIKPKNVKDSSIDDSWKDVVENPDNWWDCRANKKNPKAPDFKHKKTGDALWLNRAPGWVPSKLPPVRD